MQSGSEKKWGLKYADSRARKNNIACMPINSFITHDWVNNTCMCVYGIYAHL